MSSGDKGEDMVPNLNSIHAPRLVFSFEKISPFKFPQQEPGKPKIEKVTDSIYKPTLSNHLYFILS